MNFLRWFLLLPVVLRSQFDGNFFLNRADIMRWIFCLFHNINWIYLLFLLVGCRWLLPFETRFPSFLRSKADQSEWLFVLFQRWIDSFLPFFEFRFFWWCFLICVDGSDDVRHLLNEIIDLLFVSINLLVAFYQTGLGGFFRLLVKHSMQI